MIFEPTPLKDAWVITQEPIGDDRGYFARVFCQKELDERGIPSRIVQANTSFTRDAGTLRGLHYQTEPLPEPKFIRCVRGAFYDVIVDMRPGSSTYLRHFGIELTPGNMKMVFAPGGFAHGFLTLEPDTQAYYMVGEFYVPDYEAGVRYNDPALGIEWPAPVLQVTEKDRSWPLLQVG